MTWRIRSLPFSPFASMFALDAAALAAQGARRMTATQPHAAPCRVSLTDAAVGETLILTNRAHIDDPASPYRGAGPIFVREGARRAHPEAGDVPDMLARRLLSVRAYDADWMMVGSRGGGRRAPGRSTRCLVSPERMCAKSICIRQDAAATWRRSSGAETFRLTWRASPSWVRTVP